MFNCVPLLSTCVLMASFSRVGIGSERNKLILRSRVMKASRKARSISAGVPSTAAGVGGMLTAQDPFGGFEQNYRGIFVAQPGLDDAAAELATTEECIIGFQAEDLRLSTGQGGML